MGQKVINTPKAPEYNKIKRLKKNFENQKELDTGNDLKICRTLKKNDKNKTAFVLQNEIE